MSTKFSKFSPLEALKMLFKASNTKRYYLNKNTYGGIKVKRLPFIRSIDYPNGKKSIERIKPNYFLKFLLINKKIF